MLGKRYIEVHHIRKKDWEFASKNQLNDARVSKYINSNEKCN